MIYFGCGGSEGDIDCGGSGSDSRAPNVVQESAKLIYNVRAAQVDEAIELAERVKNIARGAALMTDTKLTVTHSAAASNLHGRKYRCPMDDSVMPEI